MKSPAGYILRELVTIVAVFALVGVGVGMISGARTVFQNGYLDHGMTEILFWRLAKSINHHLRILLIIACGNVVLYSFLRLLRITARGALSLAVIPFSVLSVLYLYGRSYWHIFRVHPGRLLGKVDVMIFLAIALLLILFMIGWYIWLRKSTGDSRSVRFAVALTRVPVLAVVFLLPVGANLLDLADWSRAGRERWNLVLISIDTLRADHLGCYGFGEDISPHIDAFASESVQFMKAVSQSSWTLPAHASLFTGYYPSALGAVNRHRSVPPSFLMLTELLRDAGYSTAAFTGGGYLNPIYGFEQGFEAYGHYTSLDSDDVWRFIDGTGGRPFFLFLHTYKVHNYDVPAELMDRLEGRFKDDFRDLESIMSFVDRHLVEELDDETWPMMEHLRDRYRLAILHIDRQFGSLMRGLRERDLLERTLVVFLSDHGEEFGEHGRTYHGGTLYNEQIHVPLIVRPPGGETGGKRIPQVVELMDVFPTILDYLELRVPGGIDGESLVRLIEDDEWSTGGMAFSEIASLVSERYAVCDSAGKLIYAPETQYLPIPGTGRLERYDLTWGPGWIERPAEIESDQVDPLVDPFQSWVARMIRLREAGASTDEIMLDPALQEELRALGYLR